MLCQKGIAKMGLRKFVVEVFSESFTAKDYD